MRTDKVRMKIKPCNKQNNEHHLHLDIIERESEITELGRHMMDKREQLAILRQEREANVLRMGKVSTRMLQIKVSKYSN